MDKEIKIISGNTGSPLENFGLANFIQAYVYEKPYFRFGNKKHWQLLEDLLKEFNLKPEKFGEFESYAKLPKPKGEGYSLVGEGQINDGFLIGEEDVDEILSEDYYYAIIPSESDYNLYPSLNHLNKVLSHFDRKIIFASQEYQTEEQKGFLRMPDESDSGLEELFDGEEYF